MRLFSLPTFQRVAMVATAIALGVALITPAAASAAEPPIRFVFRLRTPGECIYVFPAGDNPVDITLRNAGGQLKAQGTVDSNRADFCLDESTWVDSGDKLKASNGDYTRTFVVPDLSILVDRIDDRFSGTGPAGRTLRIDYAPLTSLFAEVARVRVGQDGHWTFNPRESLTGYGADVVWKSVNGDYIYAQGEAPSLTVTLGKAGFSGSTDPFADVDIALDGITDADGHATADSLGHFAGQFRDSNDDSRQIAVGDNLTAPAVAPDADWIVPDSFASANVVTDEVTGWCEDTGNLSEEASVEIRRTGHLRGRASIGVLENGQFTFDFSQPSFPGFNPANIKHGDRLVHGCMLDTGDWVNQAFVVP